MSGLCKQATTTIDSLAKHVLSSLLQLPVAEIDDGDFAERSFSGADLLKLASFMSLSVLRGTFINDRFIMCAQTCTKAPLLVEATVETVRTVRTEACARFRARVTAGAPFMVR